MKQILYVFFISSLFLMSSKVQAANFILSYADQTFPVSEADLAQWQGSQLITPSNIFKPVFNLDEELAGYLKFSPLSDPPKYLYRYKLNPIYSYISALAEKTDSPVLEPKMAIAEGRVTEFVPPKNGTKLNVYESSLKTLFALEQGRTSTTLEVFESKPKSSLGETNSLGINELVGRGVSSFKGSPSNRRHNIKIGVEKMTGIIIPPGEIFSFNKFLGEVDGEHGFLPELVIKKTGTVPEFGGGLCQVSSTTFRAAMDAGLPIKERRNHAYAVQYYAPQGTDATIYPGVVDLKFLNDTPGNLLIWPYIKDKDTLVFEFYGTRDNRQVTLQKPLQYDRKPDGSLKAEWTRVVAKDGASSTSTFKSVYQSPALFHKEEKFVTSNPAASTAPTPNTSIPFVN